MHVLPKGFHRIRHLGQNYSQFQWSRREGLAVPHAIPTILSSLEPCAAPEQARKKPAKITTFAVPDYVGAVLTDPAASQWLKTALRGALARDPVDAADDAEMLAALLGDRADRTLSRRLSALLRERVARQFAANHTDGSKP